MLSCLRAFMATLLALGVLVLPQLALAQSFSPTNSTATLTASFKLTSSGDELPASHTHHVSWTIDNSYEVKATMKAAAPSGFAGLHKRDASEQARETQRAAQAQAAATDSAGMMALAQKAMEKCGDDQACLTREVMNMSRSPEVNSAQLKNAQKNAEAAAVAPDARYQLFQSGTQSGTFKADEKSHQAFFDAACSLRNEPTCSIDSVVKGSGPLTDNKGATNLPTAVMAEYDAKGGMLIIQLPGSYVGEAERVVKSASNQAKSGASKVTRSVPASVVKDMQRVQCGECRRATGSFTVPVTDPLLGRNATMKVEWTFSRG